jgi:hypothetical protein
MVISLLIITPPVKITWSMLERGHSYSVGGFNYINHRPALILRNSGSEPRNLALRALMDAIDHLRASN